MWETGSWVENGKLSQLKNNGKQKEEKGVREMTG